MDDANLRDLTSALQAITERADNTTHADLVAIVHILCAVVRKFAQEGEELRHCSEQLHHAALKLAIKLEAPTGHSSLSWQPRRRMGVGG